METNLKADPPSLRGIIGNICKKVIILFITITMSLSTLLMPCSIGMSIQPSQVTALTVTENKKDYTETIIDGRIEELQSQGYEEIQYELTPIAKQLGVNLRVKDFSLDVEESMKEAVLKNFTFTAKYITLTEDGETIYYFKTQQESDNFITEINKYVKTDYVEKNVRKIIGAETSNEVIDNAITSKRIVAEKIEAQKKAAAAKAQAAKNQIKDTKIVSDNAIVNYAKQFIGNPYVYGGTSLTNGADCSGFVQSIYKHFGVNLPRTASAQAGAGYKVSFDNLQAGDLIFYSGDGGKSITHVAIYIGNSQIIHASTPSKGIIVSSANIMVKMTARRVV